MIMCKEADKIPGCLDTQISTGWWESWDPQSRHFKPVPKSFVSHWIPSMLSFCLSLGLVCAFSMPSHCASSLVFFKLQRLAYAMISLTQLLSSRSRKRKWRILPLDAQWDKLVARSLNSHYCWILGLYVFVVSNSMVPVLFLQISPSNFIFQGFFPTLLQLLDVTVFDIMSINSSPRRLRTWIMGTSEMESGAFHFL